MAIASMVIKEQSDGLTGETGVPGDRVTLEAG